MTFDRPAERVRGTADVYSIYRFATAVQTGEVVKMVANVQHITRGFRDGNEPAEYAYNGTFINNGVSQPLDTGKVRNSTIRGGGVKETRSVPRNG